MSKKALVPAVVEVARNFIVPATPLPAFSKGDVDKGLTPDVVYQLGMAIQATFFTSYALRPKVNLFFRDPTREASFWYRGARLRYLGPDERSQALLLLKAVDAARALPRPTPSGRGTPGWRQSTPGIYVSRKSLSDLLQFVVGFEWEGAAGPKRAWWYRVPVDEAGESPELAPEGDPGRGASTLRTLQAGFPDFTPTTRSSELLELNFVVGAQIPAERAIPWRDLKLDPPTRLPLSSYPLDARVLLIHDALDRLLEHRSPITPPA